MHTTLRTRETCAPTPPRRPAPASHPSPNLSYNSTVAQSAPFEHPKRVRLTWRRWLLAAALLVAIPAAAWAWLFQGWESEQSVIAILKPVDLASKPIFGTALQNDLGRAGWILDRDSAIQPPLHATDPDLAPIATLRNLASIDLDFTQVTDAGLVHLQNLRRLQRLDLAGTRITNAGLASLQNLKQLRMLDLESTQVTPAGVAMLKNKLPACHIYY